MFVFQESTADRLQRGSPLSLRETPVERKPVHGMAIVYANADARRNADHWCNRLIKEIGDDVLWQKNYHDAALLEVPGKRRAATEAASTAEVVVLALDRNHELSKAGQAWMKEWAAHLFDRGPILIAVHDSSRPSRHTRAATQSFLEKIAQDCGLTFLYTRGEALVEHRPVA